MTFSIIFPNILRKTLEQNILRESYINLFGLGMMIDIEFLKCKGQKLRSIQAFVILAKLIIQLLSVTRILRWHHEI